MDDVNDTERLALTCSYALSHYSAVSGLSGSAETAQSQVSVGIGLLAGSTVLVLSLIWGSCVVVGKCDIENSIAKDNKDTRGFNFIGIHVQIYFTFLLVI